MKFPGWLAIEQNQEEINLLAAGTLHRLTAQEVADAIWPKLQSSAMKLKAEYEKVEAIRQKQEVARLEAEKKKNQTEFEQKKDLEDAQRELAAMHLMQNAQTIKGLVLRSIDEGHIRRPQQQQ